MQSFLTGSRVYGTPREDSDIDLVVLIEGEVLDILQHFSDNASDFGSPGGVHYEDGMSLRFGKLNLLCVTQEKHFEVWRTGTEGLKARAPVTREFAVKYLAELRRKAKIHGW